MVVLAALSRFLVALLGLAPLPTESDLPSKDNRSLRLQYRSTNHRMTARTAQLQANMLLVQALNRLIEFLVRLVVNFLGSGPW